MSSSLSPLLLAKTVACDGSLYRLDDSQRDFVLACSVCCCDAQPVTGWLERRKKEASMRSG